MNDEVEIEVTPKMIDDLQRELAGAVDFHESIYSEALLAEMILASSLKVLSQHQCLP